MTFKEGLYLGFIFWVASISVTSRSRTALATAVPSILAAVAIATENGLCSQLRWFEGILTAFGHTKAGSLARKLRAQRPAVDVRQQLGLKFDLVFLWPLHTKNGRGNPGVTAARLKCVEPERNPFWMRLSEVRTITADRAPHLPLAVTRVQRLKDVATALYMIDISRRPPVRGTIIDIMYSSSLLSFHLR
jgi:hypothetical protein